MLAKIKYYEELSRVLEPDGKQRNILAQQVEHYINTFLLELNTSKTFNPDLISPKIYRSLAITEKPEAIASILELIKNYVVSPGLNVSAPGFLGYIPGSGLYPSALGDYIAAITNRFAGALFVSPGAVRLENILVRWMCHLVSYGNAAGGNLSSGGSLANFIAIVAARENFSLKCQDYNRVVVYTSTQVHHSIIKALRIAGLKEAIIRFIPVNKNYSLKAEVLAKLIKEDKKHRLIPWLIVATFGTTNTGAIDPIDEIAEIARQHNLWLHVDAAYGGFFLLCRSIKKRYSDILQADSITIDPHKSLFIPFGLGVVLVKNAESLLQTYYYDEVDYFPDPSHIGPYDELSPAALSPELSKHFRALRLWLPLKLYGVNAFRAALNEKLLLAKYISAQLVMIKRIEMACQPGLSIVAFRYRPSRGDPNDFNRRLYENIKLEGKVFLSTTYLHRDLYLRMACLNFRTHLDTVQLALEVIQDHIKRLVK